MKSGYILVLMVSLLVLATSVSALTISGDSSLDMCQCETVREVYTVCSGSGNYNVSLEGSGSQWFSVAPSTLSLSQGECKDVYVFVTPSCYATAGTYRLNLVVAGSTTETEPITLEVNQCHTFNYTVTPQENSSKPCEENLYNIYVKNTGKFSDKFVLQQKGLADSWVTYPREGFVLLAGEELNTTLKLKSTCSALSGSYNFDLTLANTQTNASSTKALLQKIISYTPFNHTLQSSVETCSEEAETLSFTITNVSDKNDELSLVLNGPEFMSVNKSTLSLAPNESSEVILTINPADPQTADASLSVYSKTYDKYYDLPITAEMKDCYNLSIVRAADDEGLTDEDAQENTYCLNETEQYFVVKNSGTQTQTVTVSLSGIDSEPQEITLSPQEEDVVTMTVVPKSAGAKEITATVASEKISAQTTYTISFEDCYGAQLVVPSLSACSGLSREINLVLKNNGTKSQTFDLSTDAPWAEFDDDRVTVSANSEETIKVTIDVPAEATQPYTITAESNNVTLTRTIPITILGEEACYDFSASKNSVVVDINCCDGQIVPLQLTNNGYFSQEINLTKIAPSWVAFSKDSVLVSPGETEEVFVYFSPPAGTNGYLTAQILLANQKGYEKTIDFNLNVFGGNCGVALDADLNVDNDVALQRIFTRKEIDVQFSVINDSNVGFNIIDMNVAEFPDTEIDFNRGTYLEPGQEIIAWMTLGFLENTEPPNDMNVTVNIITSVGDFQKIQQINLSKAKDGNVLTMDEVAITGFFINYVAPAVGVILLILLLVVIVVVVKKAGKEKPKKK